MTILSNSADPAARPATPAAIQWGARIPMRDGVHLNAMIFIPRGMTSSGPVVFEMTPYGIDAFYSAGLQFAANGLAFALVDSRGRGDSEGEFEMFEVDVNDTVDAIAWLAAQSWCDGQVGMYGGSYSGANQWTAAKSRPAALKTIAPWGAGCPGIDINAGGVPFIGHLSWHVLTSGRDTYWGMGADSGYWAEMLAQLYRDNRPATELAALAGLKRPKFLESLRDPHYALRAMTFLPTEAEIRGIDMPILSSTGHYDSTQPGTLFHFQRFEQFASEAARRKHYLVIGPWHHAGIDGTDRVGDLQFAPQAKVDMAELRRAWFRWAFGRGDKPSFLQHRIMYYMAGAEEWRGCDTLDEAFSTKASFYFRSTEGAASNVYHSGELSTEPTNTKVDDYTADPFDTEIIEMELRKRHIARPTNNSAIQYPDPLRGLHWQLAGEDPTDSAFAHNLRGQGLVYHSAPFENDTEIAGTPLLRLWLSLDAPDTDVVALLYEILPEDGSSILLWSDILRLRYREGWRHPQLATPGVPFECRFGTPKFMSRRIRRGSRLRLAVRSPASINYQKNLHSGKPPCEELPADARRCVVTLHHEPGRQSVLELPLARNPSGTR
jgi:uncharacterized protein